jgi:hypothetical protein
MVFVNWFLEEIERFFLKKSSIAYKAGDSADFLPKLAGYIKGAKNNSIDHEMA